MPGGRKTWCGTTASRLVAESREAVAVGVIANKDNRNAAVTLPAEVQRDEARGGSVLDNMVKGGRFQPLVGGYTMSLCRASLGREIGYI